MKKCEEYRGIRTEGLTRGARVSDPGPFAAVLPARFDRWDAFTTPIDDQGATGTCAVQAMTRITETMVSAVTGDRPRFDALRIYRAIWEMENARAWPGEKGYGTGLKPDSAFRYGIAAGLLPPDAARVVADLDTPSLVRALTFSPLFAASCVTEAWRRPGLFGEIGAADVTSSGHAWIIPGLRPGERAGAGPVQMITGANSWGTEWGAGGFFQMTAGTYAGICWINPYSIAADWPAWISTGAWRALL